jgi:hypothetical protein
MDEIVIPDSLVIEGKIQTDRPAVIWKHPLSIVGLSILHMPKGARILTVAEQNGHGYLWEIHDLAMEDILVERVFEIVGTGHVFDSAPTLYLDTYQTNGGFVWHVFEVTHG